MKEGEQMLDREKVLQALQHCPDDCSDCYTGGPGSMSLGNW